MSKFIVRRMITMIPVLLGVTLIIFTMVYFTPGDPVEMLVSETASPEYKQMMRDELKLDDPFIIRYFDYIKKLVLHGDLGTSYVTKRPVIQELIDRFPTTLILATISIVFSVLIGVTTGVISATKQYTIFDNIASAIAMIGVSVPSFWLALMLVILFAVELKWLPPTGLRGPEYLILPMVTLGVNGAGNIMRITRSSMLEVIRQDYVKTARAKGQKEIIVMLNHALKNALIPVITSIGLNFADRVAGAVLTESIFAISGLGKLMVDSIKVRDMPVVQGGVLFICIIMSLINLVVDIVYAYIDPRIRSQYVRKVRSKKANPLQSTEYT